ncbi:PREDICTED: RB1-inducible coiled-coil protein 1-like [Branchiostoma belcheri]|uniref:RB1-inducible coiled-coil protein 1 n=1 Tax=Branchiostoma belcheri TaxID=7741 RepID=A0A6P4Y0C0_BRABE|nr:PREDICTED: RB1-inducible coiled-coil protein 1-like [Branchiostoma belcheri]
MLYVFLVDTGIMLTFDMSLALQPVNVLQQEVARSLCVPADKQVMLISGGDMLESKSRVCSYSAGTDTNPIFLFSKVTIESAVPPSPSVDLGSDSDPRLQVEGCLNMPATYETVVARAQLALQFHDLAKDTVRSCEQLVHEQHLQQQGWAAVIANLEDCSSQFKIRVDSFEGLYSQYLVTRPKFMDIIQTFPNTIKLLEKIPLLPCLQGAPMQSIQSSGGVVTSRVFHPQTLLQWINAKDPSHTLEQLMEQCVRCMEQLDETVLQGLMTECNNILSSLNNPQMKEIKGLEDRLYGLEQLMAGTRKIVQEQGDMAQAFVQNQSRCSNLGDPSILPDLCASHRKQLLVMLNNHKQLRDIRRRCVIAKDELSANLHTRLRWIMYIEKAICELDSKLTIYYENIKRLKKRLEIVEQVSEAPTVYCQAVAETYRRRQFSEQFLQWAGNLSQDFTQMREEEVNRRKEFKNIFRKHFLKMMFPGMEDYPPGFATKPPDSFDKDLPFITQEDVQILQDTVPELSESLRVPTPEELQQMSQHSSRFMHFSLTSHDPTPLRGQKSQDSQATLVGPSRSSSETSACPQTTPTSEYSRSQSQDTISSKSSRNDELASVPEKEEGMTSPPAVAHMESTPQVAETSHAPRPVPHRSAPPSNVTVRRMQQQQESGSYSPDSIDSHSVDLEYGSPTKRPTVVSDSFVSVNESPDEFMSATDVWQFQEGGYKSPSSSVGTPLESVESSVVETVGNTLVVKTEGAKVKSLRSCPVAAEPPGDRVKSPSQTHAAQLQRSLQERKSTIDVLEGQLASARRELAKSEEKCRKLHELHNKIQLQLKLGLVDIRQQVQDNRKEVSSHVAAVTKQVFEAVAGLEKSVASEQESAVRGAVGKANEEKQALAAELEAKLQSEVSKCTKINQEVEALQKQLEDRKTEEQNTAQEWQKKLADMKAEFETSQKALQGRLKEEHKAKINDMKETLAQKEQFVLELQREKEVMMEDIAERFNSEKGEVVMTLRKEYEEAKKQAVTELQEKLKVDHGKALAALKDEHDTHLKSACETIQHAMDQEKGRLEKQIKELADEVESLKAERDGEIERVRESMSEDRKTEVDMLISQLEIHKEKCEEALQEIEAKEKEITKMKEDFKTEKEEAIKAAVDLEREKSQSEIQKLKDRQEEELRDRENFVQTMKKSFEMEKKEVEQEVSMERSRSQETVEGLKTRHEQELKEKQHAIAKLEKHFQEQKEELQKSVSEDQQKFEGEMEKLRAELERQLEEKDQELKSLRDTLEQEKAELIEKAVSEEKQKRESIVAELQDNFDKQSKETEDKLAALQSRLRETEEGAKQTLEGEITAIKEQQENAITEIKASLTQQISSQESEITHLKQQLEDLKKEKDDEANSLAGLKTDLERQLEEKETVISKMQTQQDSLVAEAVETERQKVTEEMNRLREEKMEESRIFEMQIEKLKESFELQKAAAVKEALGGVRQETGAAGNTGDAVTMVMEEERKKHEQELDSLRKSLESQMSSLKASMQAERQVAFNEAVSKVVAEKDGEIEALRQNHHKLMEDWGTDKGETACVLRFIIFWVRMEVLFWVAEKDGEIEALRQNHHKVMEDWGTDKGETACVLRFIIFWVRVEVLFWVAEKDREIEALRQNHHKLMEDWGTDKEALETAQSAIAAAVDERERALRLAQWREEELRALQADLDDANKKLEERPSGVSHERTPSIEQAMEAGDVEGATGMTVSTMSAITTISDSPGSEAQEDRIRSLEMSLRKKEEECMTLSQRLMQRSMSALGGPTEKVAIKDFQIGDIVLICLDERHDNYVVFTVGLVLYFLHSDSLPALDLKSAPGAPRKPWVLGQITDKEYCQAKKPQNRFKVPVGTKFYRVKAIPWGRKL